jgi:hypothetical protein
MAKWLTLLLHTQKLPGSNLGPETSYSDRGSLVFPSVPPGKSWDSTLKLGNEHFFPHPLQFIFLHLSSFREISSSHGGEYDVQSCLLGYTGMIIPDDGGSTHL